MKGKYIAVGAGPCADLITLRGLRALQKADVVLYDKLADITLLENIRAEKIYVGKIPYGSCGTRQQDINYLLEKYLSDNKCVVRLKGGDSVIFSRIVEEIETARQVGAEIEVIPGITTASAAVSRLECALTDRACASGVMFITGHSQTGKAGGLPDYDWKALVNSGLTLVVYMGVKHMDYIIRQLADNGMALETPVAIAVNIEKPDRSLELCQLKDFIRNEKISLAKNKGPVLFILGEVLLNSNLVLDTALKENAATVRQLIDQ